MRGLRSLRTRLPRRGYHDVPEEWSEYITANAEFFDDLGSPGGAAKMGPTGKDVPFIAALPPQGE